MGLIKSICLIVFKIFILFLLVYLFGSLAFSLLSKFFYFVSVFFEWLVKLIDFGLNFIGFEPLIKIDKLMLLRGGGIVWKKH